MRVHLPSLGAGHRNTAGPQILEQGCPYPLQGLSQESSQAVSQSPGAHEEAFQGHLGCSDLELLPLQEHSRENFPLNSVKHLQWEEAAPHPCLHHCSSGTSTGPGLFPVHSGCPGSEQEAVSVCPWCPVCTGHPLASVQCRRPWSVPHGLHLVVVSTCSSRLGISAMPPSPGFAPCSSPAAASPQVSSAEHTVKEQLQTTTM